MTTNRESLDDILVKRVYSEDAFERLSGGHSTPIFMMGSFLADNKRIFSDRAWKGYVKVVEDTLAKLPNGDNDPSVTMIMAGGLIDNWRFFYTKHEFNRLQQTDFSDMSLSQEEMQEFDDRLKRVKEKLDMLPPKVKLHYFYSEKDNKNMIETYSYAIEKFQQLVGGVHSELLTTIKTLHRFTKNYELFERKASEAKTTAEGKLGSALRDAERDYRWDYHSLEKDINKVKGILKRKNLSENTIKNRRRQLQSLEQRLKELDTEYSDTKQKIDEKYQKSFSKIGGKTEEKRESLLVSLVESIERRQEKIGTRIQAFESVFSIPSAKQKLRQFTSIHDNVGMVYQYLNKALEDRDKEPSEILDYIGDQIVFLNEYREALRDEFSLNELSNKITKRRIPKRYREELIHEIEKTYYKKLEDILTSEGTREAVVHDKVRDGFFIEGMAGARILTKGVGFEGHGKSKSESANQIRIDEISAVLSHDYITLPRDMDKTIEELDGMLESGRNGKNILVPDLVVVGNDHLFRATMLNYSEELPPTYMVTLGPFWDVKKAAQLYNNQIKTDETKLAMEQGATSGMMMLDFDRNSTPRFTPWSLDQLIKHSGFDFPYLKISANGDEHFGDAMMRNDLHLGLHYMIEKDENIKLYITTGDSEDNFNFRGATTEYLTNTSRLDAQTLEFIGAVSRAWDAIIRRSNLKTKVMMTVGNHGRQQHDVGFSIPEIIAHLKSLPYLMEKYGYDPRFIGLDLRLQEQGEDSPLDDAPVKSYRIGHEGYGSEDIRFEDSARKIGRIHISHKVPISGSGDKMDPVGRFVHWASNTGRVKNDTRVVHVGHSHILMIGMAFGGTYICSNGSWQTINPDVKHPEKTDNAYGISAGFFKPVEGGINSYMPYDKNKPMTFEIIPHGLMKRVYQEKVEPAFQSRVKNVTSQQIFKLTT